MKRIGKYTGTIYPGDSALNEIGECSTLIFDEQATDEVFLAQKRAEDQAECSTCVGGCSVNLGD